ADGGPFDGSLVRTSVTIDSRRSDVCTSLSGNCLITGRYSRDRKSAKPFARSFADAASVGSTISESPCWPSQGEAVRAAIDLPLNYSTKYEVGSLTLSPGPILAMTWRVQGHCVGNLEELAPKLPGAAIAYLKDNPRCELESVYFLALERQR